MKAGSSVGSGERLVDEIHAALTCPDCDYPLRGLPGPELDCPECGRPIDLTQLVTQRWTQPWYRAPKLNRAMLPVAVALVGMIGCGLASFPAGPGRSPAFWWIGLIGLGLWLTAMTFSQKCFANRREGIALALLGHLSLALYLMAMMLGLILFATCFSASAPEPASERSGGPPSSSGWPCSASSGAGVPNSSSPGG